jgi:uncharacterized protein (DUF58 family)
VILSDFKTSGYGHELALLARRHDVIAVRIIDRADLELPDIGLIALEDPETRETVSVLGTRTLRQRYERAALDLRSEWSDNCRRCGAETLEIATSDDPGLKLDEFFQRRRKRR